MNLENITNEDEGMPFTITTDNIFFVMKNARAALEGRIQDVRPMPIKVECKVVQPLALPEPL